MSKTFNQKQLMELLKSNPLNVPVYVGDLKNMNGDDYVFLDYTGESLIASDNAGCYKTSIQISIYSRDFSSRKKLVDYIKGLIQSSVTYQGSNEGNYFVAILESEIFLNA